MKLLRLNKYILQTIFGYLKVAKELNIIRYNKKIQTRVKITLYEYQKQYYKKIITPALLNNTEILLQNNIFDESTLNKLKSDWDNETTAMLQEKDCFHFDQKTKNNKNLTDTKILNFSLKEQNLLKKNAPNLIELNISNINNLELPCSFLLNLETLSLKDISKLKFISEEENISMDKLNHLYLNNVSFHKDNKIKIALNNLNYLDLRLKEQEGDNEDEEDEEDGGFDNNNNKAGFLKEKTLAHLINIFDFKFLSLFKSDSGENEDNEENEEDEDMEGENELDKFEENAETFKKPKELFEKNYISQYDYFNLEILYEYSLINGAADFAQRLLYKYLFSKTKGNKYLFKTEFTNYGDSNGEYEEVVNREIRYCNNINYDDYYFINTEAEIGGDSLENEMIKYETINSYSIVTKYDTYNYRLIKSLDQFKKDKNKLEILSIEDLDLSFVDSFMKYLKKLQNLKCFYITKDFKFKNNKQLIELLTILSRIKALFKIDIKFQSELKLNKNEEKKIKELLPNVEINKGKKESSIKWNNSNYKIIVPKSSEDLENNQMDFDD